MALRRHNASWTAAYRDSDSAYLGTSPLRASGGYTSYLGFNVSAILADIKSSKVKAKIHLRYTVTNAGGWSLGMHKETTNKASIGRPYFNFTQKSYTDDTGSGTRDISTFPSLSGYQTFRDAIEKGGFKGIVLYGSANLIQFSSMYIEVEGVWNEPPTKPKLTYPVGGETLSGSTTLRATGSTDPEGDSIWYEFSLKDGKTTYYFPAQKSLTLTVDLTKYAETSTAVVGVRAYDGQTHSGWDYSKVFTLRKNVAPTQPTLLDPVGGASRDRTKTISFGWNHNDQGAQSLFRLRWRKQGTTAWNNIQVITTDEVYAVPSNTFPYGNIEWQVQTEDQGGLASPWSVTGLFLAAEKTNAPTILSPVNGAIIPSEALTVSWSSSGQIEYEVEITDGAGVFWQVSHASGNKAVSVATPLQNNTEYAVRVRVRDTGGLWSDWAIVTVTTSFVPPPQPVLEISMDEEAAGIFIWIRNPLPGIDEPDVSYNELYRRQGEGSWLLIATNIGVDSGYMDYMPAGNTTYEYYAKAIGVNRTTMDSVPALGFLNLNHSRIQLTSDPTFYINLVFNIGSAPKTSFSYGIEATKVQFTGRKRLVTEFGELSTTDVSIEYTIKTSDMWKLEEMIEQRETLLFRDRRGRKLFVSVETYQIVDRKSDYHTVSIPMVEADFTEGLRG